MVASLACSGNIRTGEVEIYGIAKFGMPAFPESGNFIEIFNEMHYQPWHKSQEGPRLLPPLDSVPVTGREVRYTSLAAHADLQVPAAVEQIYDRDKTAEIFRINCMVCHGEAMVGDGKMADMMTKDGLSPLPADLTLPLTQDSPDGDLFAFISWGGRQGSAANFRGKQSTSPMPQFRLLLTEAERWALVMYLRSR